MLKFEQETVKDADVLIFCTPHQFTRGICSQLRGKVAPGAIAISLTKVSSSDMVAHIGGPCVLTNHDILQVAGVASMVGMHVS